SASCSENFVIPPDVSGQTLRVRAASGNWLRLYVALKVSDIDSERMLIRIEQGKGRKDRYVMLSPHLLELLRAWWKQAQPRGWLFPGRNPVLPITTRQFTRACHEAAEAAGIKKRVSPHTLRHSFATHLLEQSVDIRVIHTLLGHVKLDTTARYTQIATKVICDVVSPLDRWSARSPGTSRPPDARRACRARRWRSPRPAGLCLAAAGEQAHGGSG